MMKILQLLFVLLIFPTVFYAQKSLTGLWVGTLGNDSVTIRKDQAFEIALTEYRGKVYGYSRMTFTVNDTLYYIIKRVKGSIDGDICEVKDDDIIRHNFPHKPDKGVKLISTFRRSQQDSVWRLDGDWKTTESKRHGYYSISGSISLRSEPDLAKSKLFPHLEELDLAKKVDFYAVAKKKEEEQKNYTGSTVKNNNNKPEAKPAVAKTDQPEKAQQGDLNKQLPQETKGIAAVKENNKTNTASVQQTSAPAEQAYVFTGLKKTSAPVKNIPKEEVNINADAARPEAKNTVAIKENKLPVPEEPSQADSLKKDTALAKLGPPKQLPAGDIAKPIINPQAAAAKVAERKLAAAQVLEFKSDSLVIKLYDNGEIDGDTVSVLLNGEILLAKQGLKASAIRKTIYIAPGQDELNLVLYAENLGKYPPNTGLLIVNDGETVHQLRFSADLQQNAAIIFRRKK